MLVVFGILTLRKILRSLRVFRSWFESLSKVMAISYEELLQLTKLPTLATRKCFLFYTMVNRLATFPNLPTVFRSTPYGNSIRSISSSSMVQPFAHSNFYFLSCIRLWNSLPPDVSAISTLPTSKHAIVNLF